MSGKLAHQISTWRKLYPIVRRYVSTSKKNNETVVPEAFKSSTNTSAAERNWVSYGYDHYNKESDRNAMHSIMFVSVTLCLVVGGFFWAYIPDFSLRDWSQREAYLELRRREEKGLPPIDRNFIDPSKFDLPSDEELGDIDVIV